MADRGRSTWALVVLAGMVLAVLACGGGLPLVGVQPPETPTPTSPPPATQAADQTAEANSPEIAELPASGQLAVIDMDSNLVVLRRGESPRMISDDATSIDTETLSGRVYQHPTWSVSGWLSYVRAETLPDQPPRLDVLAVRPAESEPTTILSSTDATYVYGYWSPAACSGAPDCGRFAYLMNDGDRLALHLAEVSNGDAPQATDTIIGRAAPFYYSWAPDGTSMLWYRNERTLAIYDIVSEDVREELPDSAGRFMAPAWSPVDERLLVARAEANRSRMTVIDGEDRIELGLPIEGYAHFNWSPDGRQIAYTSGGDTLEPITVINADGSGGRVLAAVPDVVAFFWSPDSTRLAVVALVLNESPLPQAGSGIRARQVEQQRNPEDFAFAWYVFDVASGEATRFTQFLPTAEQWYTLKFFDQFAQSQRVWSPDSRYVVYAEQDRDSREQTIRLIDVEKPGEEPLQVMAGTNAVFSFGE